MKTYIVIHNLNSRGKNLSQEYIEDLFKSKNIPFMYFSTSTIDELNNVIVEYSDDLIAEQLFEMFSPVNKELNTNRF